MSLTTFPYSCFKLDSGRYPIVTNADQRITIFSCDCHMTRSRDTIRARRSRDTILACLKAKMDFFSLREKIAAQRLQDSRLSRARQ